ncbi:hypothetical protein [Streptomyces sp. NPDC052811]|uniref:LGFP repeat-containing protein n=1 Tax=Streptomyces sp. NPDC052811 TaxID=3155731 RepID=UPI00344539B1
MAGPHPRADAAAVGHLPLPCLTSAPRRRPLPVVPGEDAAAITDELKNPDGIAVRQQFQNATVYWSPSTGAHAVHGNIGSWWGLYGYEAGAYGYPTSDECNAGHVGGNVDDNNGIRQDFQSGKYLLWSGGQADAFEACQTACIGYGGVTNTKWVDKTEVYINWTNSRLTSVHVTPTPAAFKTVTGSDDAASDLPDDAASKCNWDTDS